MESSDLDGQDGQNVSDAFVERVRKGMDALTVRGEMDKELAKEQEKFRDFATHDMLAAADKYDNGTTQVLIAKPNRSQTHIVGRLSGSGWPSPWGTRYCSQLESSLARMGRQSGALLARAVTSCATTILCHALAFML